MLTLKTPPKQTGAGKLDETSMHPEANMLFAAMAYDQTVRLIHHATVKALAMIITINLGLGVVFLLKS